MWIINLDQCFHGKQVWVPLAAPPAMAPRARPEAVWRGKLRPDICGSLTSISWRRQWHPTPVLLPGKSHGQRSLVGCRPWGREEPDTTERLHFHFSLSYIGEGNGNPLQCSCLENPRDGGALWATVYGVAQSRTRLKRLSSSSSSNFNQHFHGKQVGASVASTPPTSNGSQG